MIIFKLTKFNNSYFFTRVHSLVKKIFAFIKYNMGVVYKITCLPTGKSYVGKTTQKFSTRIKQHRDKSSYCRLLSESIKDYGWDNFTVEILWEGDNKLLGDIERKLIAEKNTLSPNGYNLREGGGRSEKVSDQSRQLMIQKQKEITLKRNGVLGSIVANKSKVDWRITSWSLRGYINGEFNTIANSETKEEILEIQKEYTKDPDGYNIPQSKRMGNGKASGVYLYKPRNKWVTNVENKYLGMYDTKEKAISVVKEYKENPDTFVRQVKKSERKNSEREDIGVTYKNCISKWRASIWINGKTLDLGKYSTKEEAISARKKFIENPDTFVRPNQRKKIKL